MSLLLCHLYSPYPAYLVSYVYTYSFLVLCLPSLLCLPYACLPYAYSPMSYARLHNIPCHVRMYILLVSLAS